MSDHQLLIQTALKQSLLALFSDGSCIAQKEVCLDHRSDNTYVNDIYSMLHQEGLKPSSLKSIFLVHGPGYFTGVRSGVIIVKALYQLFEIGVNLVSSFDYLAGCIQKRPSHFGILIATSKREGFYQEFLQEETHVPSMESIENLAEKCTTVPIFSDQKELCKNWGFHPVLPLAKLPGKYQQARSLNEIYPEYIRREEELFR